MEAPPRPRATGRPVRAGQRLAAREPFVQIVRVGEDRTAGGVHVAVNRQSFLAFPALNGREPAPQVVRDLLPGIQAPARCRRRDD